MINSSISYLLRCIQNQLYRRFPIQWSETRRCKTLTTLRPIHGGMCNFSEEVEKEIGMKRIRFLAVPLLVVLMGIALLLPLSAGAASTHAPSKHTGSLTQAVTNDPA